MTEQIYTEPQPKPAERILKISNETHASFNISNIHVMSPTTTCATAYGMPEYMPAACSL